MFPMRPLTIDESLSHPIYNECLTIPATYQLAQFAYNAYIPRNSTAYLANDIYRRAYIKLTKAVVAYYAYYYPATDLAERAIMEERHNLHNAKSNIYAYSASMFTGITANEQAEKIIRLSEGPMYILGVLYSLPKIYPTPGYITNLYAELLSDPYPITQENDYGTLLADREKGQRSDQATTYAS